MIKINDRQICPEHFLAGEQRIFDAYLDSCDDKDPITFKLHYQNDEEIMTLYMLSKHFRDQYPNRSQILKMPYIPNARMDRVNAPEQLFTLKYFAQLINSLNFDKVLSLDAHSDVSLALIDRIENLAPVGFIRGVIDTIVRENSKLRYDDIVLYFPDAGAYKRYGSSAFLKNFKQVYGEKKRDFSTGKILGLEIKTMGVDLTGKTVLMIDDIISYGGTMYYSALELKNNNVGQIYAYASHVENAVLDKEHGTLIKAIDDGTVTKLYTTNSIFTASHPKIRVLTC